MKIMKNMKKQKFFFVLLVSILFLGVKDVYAAVPTMGFAQGKTTSYTHSGETINIPITLENITDPVTLHYTLDNGSESNKKIELTIGTDELALNYNDLSSNCEHSIKIWATNDAGEKSNEETQEFVILEESEKVFTSEEFEFKIMYYPTNSIFLMKKINDNSVMDKLGSNSVYLSNFSANEKTLDYYIEKYNVDFDIIVTGGTVKKPSNLKSENMFLYFSTTDLSNLKTKEDCNSTDDESKCDGVFEIQTGMIAAKYLNNGYFYFKSNDTMWHTTETNNSSQTVKVGNTAAKTSLIIFAVSLVLLGFGTFIICKSLKKRINIKN